MELRELLENNIKIVNHYETLEQLPVWIEEMSELTKVLCKWNRKSKTLKEIDTELLEQIKEEITDVTICLDQLRYVIGFDEEEMLNIYKSKVERQLKRIEEEKCKK